MVNEGITRRRRIAGMALIVVVVLALVGAAAAKFLGVPAITTQLTGFGFSSEWIIVLGVIELASAVLFAIPGTRALGLLLITGFLGGAIATHISTVNRRPNPRCYWLWAGRASGCVTLGRIGVISRSLPPYQRMRPRSR
jgi:hypothetical protein